MANNYTEIMKIVNQGNKMGLSNTITRDNGIPLDLSSVQESYEAAVIYAATKSIAYVGQPISVGGKLYLISETAAEEKFIAADGTQYDNYLIEVGSKAEGNVDLTDINNAIAANTAAIIALAGEGNTSTVKKNADDIAALDATLKAALENDGEGLDSIKELAVWIQDHETEVLPVINAHSAILAGIGGEGEKATVVDYVTDAIAAIPVYDLPAATLEALGGVKLSNEVGTNDNGQLEIKELSTDKLAQGTQEFVLNGGNAKVSANA